jgi:hypothetical protein
LNKNVLRLHSKNLTSTILVPKSYSTKLIQYCHGEMLMLIIGLYSRYINKTTSNSTSLSTSLQHLKKNTLESLLGFGIN